MKVEVLRLFCKGLEDASARRAVPEVHRHLMLLNQLSDQLMLSFGQCMHGWNVYGAELASVVQANLIFLSCLCA